MTAFARAIAVVAFWALTLSALPARADVPRGPAARAMRLRVLTFNVFGIAPLSPAIDERMAAIGPAIVALSPDVVLLQEMWRSEDAARVGGVLESAGYVAVRSFASDHWTDRGRGGLMIASRLAIVGERFEPFDAGTLPHIPWHVDWRGGKGFFTARLATPVGEVGVVNVHAQASYATGHYEAIRVAQALQMARALHQPDAMAPADAPLILGGDLNAPPAAGSNRALAALTRSRVCDETLGTDMILARSGSDVAVDIVSTRRVLLDPIRTADGTFVPLSDHEGILVELALRRCDGRCGADPVADPEAAVAVAREDVVADRGRTAWYQVATGVGALGSAWLAVRTGRGIRGARRRRERAGRSALVLWCLFWASWWTYTCFVFAPQHLAILDGVLVELEGGAAGWIARHAPVTDRAGRRR